MIRRQDTHKVVIVLQESSFIKTNTTKTRRNMQIEQCITWQCKML